MVHGKTHTQLWRRHALERGGGGGVGGLDPGGGGLTLLLANRTLKHIQRRRRRKIFFITKAHTWLTQQNQILRQSRGVHSSFSTPLSSLSLWRVVEVTHTHAHTHTRARTHTHIYTHTYTYTQMQTQEISRNKHRVYILQIQHHTLGGGGIINQVGPKNGLRARCQWHKHIHMEHQE